jgi:hypothetical protein
MKPRKPIKRKTALPRSSKRIRSRGRDRFKGRRNDAYRELVTATYPCEIEGRMVTPTLRHKCSGILEFAHVEAKGIGGYDVGNGVSLCTEAHTAAPWSLHLDGPKSFDTRFGINLAARARDIAIELGYGEDAA